MAMNFLGPFFVYIFEEYARFHFDEEGGYIWKGGEGERQLDEAGSTTILERGERKDV